MSRYAIPAAGLPSQMTLHTGRAVFTEAYAVIPHGVMRDIVTSYLPHWRDTLAWVIARPLSGFAETFSQYVVEVKPGGGSDRPEPNPEAEGVLFVVSGEGGVPRGERAIERALGEGKGVLRCLELERAAKELLVGRTILWGRTSLFDEQRR